MNCFGFVDGKNVPVLGLDKTKKYFLTDTNEYMPLSFNQLLFQMD